MNCRAQVLPAAVIAIAAVVSGCGSSGSPASSRPANGLVRVHSGLLVDQPFAAPESPATLQKDYELGGSAPAARAYARAGSDGLRVGVLRHAPGVFAGYFAVTRAAYPAGAVFHVRMWRQGLKTAVSTSQTGEAVFAVQTGNTKQTGLINYVLVASVRNGGFAHWELGYAAGHLANAKTYVLWSGPPGPSATVSPYEDVTLSTDGYHRYSVYLGNRLVYSSRHLSMNIQPPFQAYLEVQALQIAYESRFQDFWVTRSDTVQVSGLRSGARVSLAPSGRPAVNAVADSSGVARLTLPLPQARGTGTFTITGSGPTRTFAGIAYAGGDQFRLGS